MLPRKLQTLAWIAMSSTFAFTSCSTNIRDALIGGAMDWIAGSATEVLSNLFPLDSSGDFGLFPDNTSSAGSR
jgi:hypothetical protein